MPTTHSHRQLGGRLALELLIAWLGGAAFVCSLLFFLYFFAIALGRSAGAVWDTGLARPLAINIALFGVFALHHSVLARPAVKRWVARRVPGHLERSLYVWIASGLFFGTCYWWQPLPGQVYLLSGVARAAGLGSEIAGLLLIAYATTFLDPLELAGIRQVQARSHVTGSPSSPVEAAASTVPLTPLTARGPYGLVRHPLYLGWILLVWGVPTMTAGRLAFAAISTAYVLLAIPWEERALRQTYGAAYRDYSRKVRWRIVPLLY